MPRKIDPEKLKLLDDKNWLYRKHVVEKFSIVKIAAMLQVTPASVRKRLRKHNIRSPSQQELREASNLRKFGKKNPGQVKEFREKAIATMTERYGGHNWSHQGNRKKRDQTCLEKYGDVNVGRTDYAKTKAEKTNLRKYDRRHKNQTHLSLDVFNKMQDKEWLFQQHIYHKKNITEISNEIGVSWASVRTSLVSQNITLQSYTHKLPLDIIKKLTDRDWLEMQNSTRKKSGCEIAKDLGVDPWTVQRHFKELGLTIQLHPHSSGEKEVLDFIQTLLPDTDIISNTRNLIPPKELDIYVPSRQLAIEYCGLYWHSDKFKKNYYHRDKLHLCQEKGIQLLTIFEDEWQQKQKQVKAKIKSVFGVDDRPKVYARQTNVVGVNTKEKNEFLNQYHIQGTGPGSITYGLVHNNGIVAVMTFIKRHSGKYELNRYATSCRVVGGFSKLLKHFQRNHNWRQITTFADLRISDGKLYETTGWKLDKILPPDYYWVKNGNRFHKFNFRHKFLSDKLDRYDPTLSENENCKRNGYLKIFNCGLKRYILVQ